MSNITQDDQDFIISQRGSIPSKLILKRLQSIWNLFREDKTNYCFCSHPEREQFHNSFYQWYDHLIATNTEIQNKIDNRNDIISSIIPEYKKK